jgi:tetratricopeptide (TPR) repeat protein
LQYARKLLAPSIRKLRRLSTTWPFCSRTKGDLEEAHLLYERALAIREKALGRDHPVTAISIMNFAILQQEQSHFSGARPLYERALEICAQANIVRYNWGPFSPQNRSADRCARSKTALAAEARIFGPNQSHTAGLARVTGFDALGRTEDAKALRERYGLRGSMK